MYMFMLNAYCCFIVLTCSLFIFEFQCFGYSVSLNDFLNYPPVRGDWLLGFLYRSSSAQLSVAGLQPINIQDRRIINVDLSSVVSQSSY